MNLSKNSRIINSLKQLHLNFSYEDLLQEKQNLEDAFLNFRREVKNTTKGSAVKEVRVLKNVVRNLEEELLNEKRKHQRAASKRNQEYKALLEEVSKVVARDPSTRPYKVQITPWTGRIKKFNRCDILKIVVEEVLRT